MTEELTAQEHIFRGSTSPRFVQDALDGAALRELREALPEDGGWLVEDDGEDGVLVYAGPRYSHDYEGRGATIAEAADKVTAKLREALG